MRQAASLAHPVVTISVDCDEEEEVSEETMREVTMEDMEVMREEDRMEEPCNCTWTIYTDAGLGKSTISFQLEQEVKPGKWQSALTKHGNKLCQTRAFCG